MSPFPDTSSRNSASPSTTAPAHSGPRPGTGLPGSGRGLPPITTSSANSNHTRPLGPNHNYTPGVSSPSHPPNPHNPTSAAPATSTNRQVASRQSSTSSTSSFLSPVSSAHATGFFSTANRSRNAPASTSSPRLASSLTSLPSVGGSAGGGTARFARHSPSLSLSTSAGSPVSSTGPLSAGGSSGQLTSLVITQLNILLSTLKEDKDRVKWEAQADKIRRLIIESGMELFPTYFRRLLQSNASTIFPGARTTTTGQENAGSYQLLVDEVQNIVKDPHQADKIAQSLDTGEGDLYRDFDLNTFVEHFRLDAIAKAALSLACVRVSKAELQSKAEALLASTFPHFLTALSSDFDTDLPPSIVALITDRLIRDPPRFWSDDQRDNLFYAIRIRYNNGLQQRVPLAIETAMYLDELLSDSDSRLAKLVQRAGPRGTSTIEACKDMLAGAETRDISYKQITSALLFTVIAENGDAYNAGILVEGLRQHRVGSKIDWTDVVQGLDRKNVRVTKKQFLALYSALLPLAREYANFDIQSLWGDRAPGQPWAFPDTQLSFVVAFLTTTPEELDVMQIPNLRQAFDLTNFATASEDVRAFAEQAIKHPLVSKDATEALFNMIFRSQEAYNTAQSLGIPDTVINTNMTIFVCAASAVAKPWAPLQDQALKQLFYPFLTKQHGNYDFVMHALWQHDKTWIATRMVEFYQQDQMLLTRIFEHAFEHGWLELLFTIQSSFAVDLASYAHRLGECNLEEWAHQHISHLGPRQFARALEEFLKAKMIFESQVQRERTPPNSPPLAVKTVHILLMLMSDAVPDEDLGFTYRQCLQLYPRLFNYGEDERRNAIIDANSTNGNVLPEDATKEMEERYKEMYGGSTNPESLVTELNRLKVSEDAAEQELFAAMLFGLFEEYNCFGEYPNEALATTAVLFGGLVSHHVLSGIAEQAAIFMIFEAVSEYGPDDPMYRFGLQALLHVLSRLKEWPHLAERILHTPSLRGTQAVTAAEATLKELQNDSMGTNGDAPNGIANGVVDDEFPADATIPPFSAIQVDRPSTDNHFEEPDEEISDKVMFVLNNVSKRNFEEKFKEIDGALEDKYNQWFAHYLVEDLAKSQPNFQSLYLSVLEKFNKKVLWAEVLRETYLSCQKMLNAQSTMDNQHERALLKNLAAWLGSITLARNQPILHRNLSFKDLLIEGYDTQRLLVAIPFTCKTLGAAKYSKVFKPPNPWMAELLGVLSELYHCIELKLNMKFEIEMLCRELDVDIKKIEPLQAIRSRPLLDQSMLQYVPDGGPDAFGDMALMGLSKRGPNERFSPNAVIEAVPHLDNMLQIPQAVGNIAQAQLRNIFVNAAQQAIYEIIAPVVERSVTIASISTSELIQKDFITEGDESKVRNSAHTVVKALSGSLALVTCKEPLRMSITNNIRILASRNLPEQLPEGQILMFVNDNIDTVCGLVENAAEEHSLAEIDLQLQQAIDLRRQHNEQRPNEPFAQTPPSRWSTLIPDPYRQDVNGLNRQQLALYEDFGRQARLAPVTHANSVSQDSNRQLPDVLSEGYLPNLPTPAEAPAMPRPTPQQRIQAMQTAQGQHQVNGYIENPNIGQRIVELMQELQAATREATEDRVTDIGEGATIRRVYGQLVGLVESAASMDELALRSGNQCLHLIFGDAQKRLEIEVFSRLLMQLCRMSVPAGRAITMTLATNDEERIYNAPATVSLHNEGLLDLQHIDNQIARGIKARRGAVLPFLRDIVDEMLLGENAIAFRGDFILTYEALGQWLAEEPDLEMAREIRSKLQLPASQVNGMPSPESETTKTDQHEYIFEEWLRLQHKELPERSFLAFIQQLHANHVVSEQENAIVFFRACMEYSVAEFDRISSNPYGSQDQAYVPIDALAKLVALMVAYQSPVDAEPQVPKVKAFEAHVALIVLIMADHHNKQRERWNGRVYFRLFSTLLCEMHSLRQLFTAEQQRDLSMAFAKAFLALQPRYFSGFTHQWLCLISHRLFVEALVAGAGRTNGGWNCFTQLLTALFLGLGSLLSMPESTPVAQEFYRGVLRFFTMLHHDFPEFLIENHMQLNASIPMQCLQLQNIVNSAVTRAVFNDQPDPFTPGLKINRYEQVRQAPAVHSDIARVLDEAGIKATIERVCAGNDLSEQDFETVRSAVDREDGQVSAILINAITLHIGVHTTSASSVFSSAVAPARLLERLLRETRPESRYHIISAMANQVRYLNAHTHYFSTALQHMFSIGSPELQEQIMRVLCERLMVPRPHPWGLIVMMLEMVKNQNYDIWNLPWMKTAPQVESMLVNLAQSQDHRMNRSPLGNIM